MLQANLMNQLSIYIFYALFSTWIYVEYSNAYPESQSQTFFNSPIPYADTSVRDNINFCSMIATYSLGFFNHLSERAQKMVTFKKLT